MTQDQIGQNEIISYEKGSKPYGLTYGTWSVKWWQWALSTPVSISPIADYNGRAWNINQPPSNVWFLAGKFGNTDKNFPNRVTKLPAGRSIRFPVLNCEANPLEYPELKTYDQLIKRVTDDVNTVIKRTC